MKANNDLFTIEVVIAPDGTIEGEVQGLLGKSCEGILASIIGQEGEVISHTRTREYKLQARAAARRARIGQ